MRRVLLATVVTVALMAQLTVGVSAVGPGGWQHLGNGGSTTIPALNGAVYALNADNPGILYAGGTFTSAGGHANAAHIAEWDGSSWSALGPVKLNGAVNAIAYHAGKVYVGGQFTNAGGDPNVDFLAVWNGSTWASPCNSVTAGSAITASVQALQIIGNTLYVGGSFGNGGGLAAADFLVACDLTTGAPHATVLHDGDFNSGVSALTADSNGTLYAGGGFISLQGIAGVDHVAYYQGGTWHAMGGINAVDSRVRSLAAHGTDVYVGTDAVNINGIAKADHIAKWNAQTLSYSALGSNTAGTNGWFDGFAFLYSMATSGSLLFVAGSFQNANGQATADDIAYFDGTTWRPLGSDGAGNGPLNAQVSAVATFQHRLVAGGNFTNAGGDPLADGIGAYAILRPDARIGLHPAGPFAGDNVYGSSQSKTISVARGHSGTLYVDFQNDGLIADTFTVYGSGGTQGFTLSYFHGATDVSVEVRSGTYSTGILARHAHQTLRVVIAVSATSAAFVGFPAWATSKPGTALDVVVAWVNAT